MVFGFFFQATFGVASGVGLAVLLFLWIYSRFIGGIGKGGKRC